MKRTLFLVLALQCSIGVAQDAAPLAGQIGNSPAERESVAAEVERGPHHKVWERIEYEPSIFGKVVPHRRSYLELATGMHYRDGDRWLESEEKIEILPDNAGAIAAKGQHKAILPPEIKGGLVELNTPDNQWLRSRVWGLAYFDSSSGESVLLAEVKESEGQLVGDNVVIYSDAFTDFRADLRYTYTKAGFEQDVVLRERPPAPDKLGLRPETTRLQVLTEFVEAAQPSKLQRAAGGLTDESLSFGQMNIGLGKAFSVDEAGESSGPEPVAKGWQQLEGRDFLIEEVWYDNVADQLQKLPETTKYEGAGLLRRGQGENVVAALKKVMPKRYAKTVPKTGIKRMAKTTIDTSSSFVMDYLLTLSSQTNFVFTNATTFYISGPVTMSGTTVFEGGAIIKYNIAANAGITASNVTWLGDMYRPVIFTSKNDNSVGDTVSGSTGNPTTAFAGGIALDLSAQSNPVITHVRFSYLSNVLNGANITLHNAQFNQCYSVFADGASNFTLRNVLGYKLHTLQKQSCTTCTPANVVAENVTLHYCTNFVTAITNANIALTNCLFVQVTNLQPATIITNSSFILGSDTGVFKTISGGSHYLNTNSVYRNVGTTNINADLLAGLKKRTTYPPFAFTNANLPFYGTLSPQAQRDFDVVDAGYHYDPLDYIFGGCHVTNDLTFTAGTAVGWFRYNSGYTHAGHGLRIADYKTLNFSGLVNSYCHYVHQTTAQEGLVGYGVNVAATGAITGWAADTNSRPNLNVLFTRFAMPAGANHTRDDNGTLKVTANHSEFYGGGLGGYVSTIGLTNCLFHRSFLWLEGGVADYFAVQSCTILGAAINIHRWPESSGGPGTGKVPVTMVGCAFENDTFLGADEHGYDTNWTWYANNAYITGKPRTPWGSNDVSVTSFNWQSSWLGNYYLPSDSILIDAGNAASAATVGLYHFTTQTNEYSKETTSQVDIGYHYVGVDAYGVPLDYDSDGVPDYIEDPNGNGLVDSSETDWQSATDSGLRVWITQPKRSANLP